MNEDTDMVIKAPIRSLTLQHATGRLSSHTCWEKGSYDFLATPTLPGSRKLSYLSLRESKTIKD